MEPHDTHESRHDTSSFEDERWKNFTQPKEFRHDAALSLITKGPVLDIGCGDGLMLSLLSECGIEAEGADISAEAVAQCTKRGLTARVYDPAHALPYADASFATVILIDVLEHVYDPAALLAEAVRISSGEVVVGVPNFSSLPARIQVLFGRVPENNQPNKGHLYWFNRNVLDKITRASGLTQTAIRMNTFRPFTNLDSKVIGENANLLALSFVARYEKVPHDTASHSDMDK